MYLSIDQAYVVCRGTIWIQITQGLIVAVDNGDREIAAEARNNIHCCQTRNKMLHFVTTSRALVMLPLIVAAALACMNVQNSVDLHMFGALNPSCSTQPTTSTIMAAPFPSLLSSLPFKYYLLIMCLYLHFSFASASFSETKIRYENFLFHPL